MARQQIIEDEFAKLRETIDTTVATDQETQEQYVSQVTINTSESGVVANPTTYDVKDFTPSKASGLSVAVVVDGTTAIGAGLCKKVAADKYQVTINGSSFLYNSKGEGISANALGTKLRLGENSTSVRGQGNSFTRGQGGNYQTVNVLNARDEFAMHILGELLKAVPDPALLSTTEMGYYSKLAYTWAAYMMEEAANGRDNDSGSAVSNYATNTEALLGQIAEAIGDIGSGQSSGGGETNGTVKIIDGASTPNILGASSAHPFHVEGLLKYPVKSELASLTSPDSFLTFDSSDVHRYTPLASARSAILSANCINSAQLMNNIVTWSKLHNYVKNDFEELLSVLRDTCKILQYSFDTNSYTITARPREYHGQSEGTFYYIGSVTLDSKTVTNPVFRLYYGHIYLYIDSSQSNVYVTYNFTSGECEVSNATYSSSDSSINTALNKLIGILSDNYGKTPAYTIDTSIGKVQPTNTSSLTVNGFIMED